VGMSRSSQASRSVFVGNIPYSATEEQLEDVFRTVGQVVSFRCLILNPFYSLPRLKKKQSWARKDDCCSASACCYQGGYDTDPQLQGCAIRVEGLSCFCACCCARLARPCVHRTLEWINGVQLMSRVL